MSLLSKFTSFSFGSWISLAIGFVSTPLITRLFSPEDFGKASMFNLVINISMIVILLGTDQSYVRFFYEETKEKRKYLLKNSLKLPLLFSIFMIFLSLIFRSKLSYFLYGKENLRMIYFFSFSVVIYVINRFSMLVVRMEQKGKVFSILQISSKLFELIIIILFVTFFGSKFENLIYAKVLAIILVSLMAIYYTYENWTFFPEKSPHKHSTIEILKYGFPGLANTLIIWLFQSFDRLAIREWLGMSELGVYVAAFKIIAILNIIQTTFVTFWTPVAFETYEKNKKDTHFFENISRTVSTIMIFIAVGIIMLKDIIVLLLGKEFRDASSIMPFLVFMPVMYTISETTVIGINFKKKIKYHVVIAGIVCLLNILGNFCFVPVLGAKGAAISTGLSYVVFFGLRTYISLKYYSVNYHLKKLSFIIFFIILYAIYNSFYSNLIINLISGFTIVALIVILNFSFIKLLLLKLKEELISTIGLRDIL